MMLCGLIALFLLLVPVAKATGYQLAPPDDLGRCKIRVVEAAGTSMIPLVRPGESLLMLENYYATHQVQRGDYVAVSHPAYKDPLGKLVLGVPGDRWSIESRNGSRGIVVNGKALRNSEGQEYQLSDREASLLLKYADNHPTIPDGAVLLLGDNPNEGVDSRKFGLIGIGSLLGRIVRKAEAPR